MFQQDLYDISTVLLIHVVETTEYYVRIITLKAKFTIKLNQIFFKQYAFGLNKYFYILILIQFMFHLFPIQHGHFTFV